MNTHRILMLAILAAALSSAFAENASAQDIESKLRASFSQPVQVPGVVLPAGNYVLESLEPGHLTRILSADERHVYATLFTVPDEKMQPAGKAVVLMRERPEGSPERIESWFDPGSLAGREFIYPGARGGKDLTALIHTSTSLAGRATLDCGKGVIAISEFAAKHTERLVVDSAKEIAHKTAYVFKALAG